MPIMRPLPIITEKHKQHRRYAKPVKTVIASSIAIRTIILRRIINIRAGASRPFTIFRSYDTEGRDP